MSGNFLSPALNPSATLPDRSGLSAPADPILQGYFSDDKTTPVDYDFLNGVIRTFEKIREAYNTSGSSGPLHSDVLLDAFEKFKTTVVPKKRGFEFDLTDGIDLADPAGDASPPTAFDWQSTIQAKEDAANAVYVATGEKQVLYWPSGTFRIKSSIVKRKGVRWHGPGKLQRWDVADGIASNGAPGAVLTSQFALVVSDEVSVSERNGDWDIIGLNFRSLDHLTIISNNIPRGSSDSPLIGNKNSLVDMKSTENISIKGCSGIGFSQGFVRNAGVHNYDISDNFLDEGTGVDPEEMLDGSITSNPAYPADYWDVKQAKLTYGFDPKYLTGGVIHYYEGQALTNVNPYGRVVNNFIKVPSLDMGIETHNQAYGKQPTITLGNFVFGANSGIQTYKGSRSDAFMPQIIPIDYRAHHIVTANLVYCTWLQGLYIRGMLSVMCSDNLMLKTAQAGANDEGSVAAIMSRVNTHDRKDTYVLDRDTGITSPPVFSNKFVQADNASVVIKNNIIVDPGRPTLGLTAAIKGSAHTTLIEGNDLSRSNAPYDGTDFGGYRVITDDDIAGDPGLFEFRGKAIVMDLGSNIREGYIRNNKIDNFCIPLTWSKNQVVMNAGPHVVEGNTCIRFGTAAIIEARTITPFVFRRNHFYNGDKVCSVAFTPFFFFENNQVHNCTQGLLNRADNAPSVVPSLLKPSAITHTNIRGGAWVVQDNEFFNCPTPFAINNATAGDSSFRGRCRVWRNNNVDGRPVLERQYAIDSGEGEYRFSAGAPNTGMNETGSWHLRDVVRNVEPAPGELYSKVVSAPGTYGKVFSTTATLSTEPDGRRYIHACADWDGISTDQYFKITDGEVSPNESVAWFANAYWDGVEFDYDSNGDTTLDAFRVERELVGGEPQDVTETNVHNTALWKVYIKQADSVTLVDGPVTIDVVDPTFIPLLPFPEDSVEVPASEESETTTPHSFAAFGAWEPTSVVVDFTTEKAQTVDFEAMVLNCSPKTIYGRLNIEQDTGSGFNPFRTTEFGWASPSTQDITAGSRAHQSFKETFNTPATYRAVLELRMQFFSGEDATLPASQGTHVRGGSIVANRLRVDYVL